ncbi:MAG: hypothetical protein WA687_08450 [Solirubrobacterales bacterium]
MSKNANERTTRRGRLRFHLAVVAVVALSLAVPAIAAAHPAVYDVTKKVAPGGCEWPNTGGCMNDGAKRYVVVNHNIPVAYDETNGLGDSYGGVINFQRFPGSYRSTVPTPADWLAVLPPRTGVQAHATCESTPTSSATNIVGWQGAEPFYAYIPWQGTSAGIDDDPADWIGYVKTLTGKDLTGMNASAAEAACESLPGATATSYHPADTPLATSIASGLVAHEVEHATEPLHAEIDALTGEKSSLQAQIDAWKSKGSSLEGQVAALSGAKATLEGELAASERAKAKLKKANTRKQKTIKRLREQLKAAGQNG